MEEKKRIEDSPFLLIIKTQRCYSRSDLQLEIEILGRKEVLWLTHSKTISKLGLIKGPRPSKLSPSFDFDKDGNRFFNELRPNFGKVCVKIPGKQKISFQSFEEFLSEIGYIPGES